MLQLDELEEVKMLSYENAKIFKKKTKLWHDKYIHSHVFETFQQVLFFNSKLKFFPGKLKS